MEKKRFLKFNTMLFLSALFLIGCNKGGGDSNKIIITFDANGGTVDTATLEVDKGIKWEAVTNIPAATKEGGTFTFWSISKDNPTKLDGGYIFDEDTTLFANYDMSKCVVTFDTDGGPLIDPQTVTYGECATKPIDPMKSDLERNYLLKEWQLDGNSFDFKTPIKSNITLKAVYDDTGKYWWEDNNYISNLGINDIGLERGVTINNQLHKVRLIGIDHDKDKDGNTLHTTWEFANLISDENGYSLGTFWKDTDEFLCNIDYLNSTIRKNLTGEGEDANPGFYLKGETRHSTSPRYTRPILDMLPSTLKDALRTTKKTVGVGILYTETVCNDKLFLLSPKEMGFSSSYDEGYGSTYNYYLNHTEETDSIRIKYQVKWHEGASEDCVVIADAKQDIEECHNYAGFNPSNVEKYGGYYWLRSPCSSKYFLSFTSYFDGSITPGVSNTLAYGVAPAFCL